MWFWCLSASFQLYFKRLTWLSVAPTTLWTITVKRLRSTELKSLVGFKVLLTNVLLLWKVETLLLISKWINHMNKEKECYILQNNGGILKKWFSIRESQHTHCRSAQVNASFVIFNIPIKCWSQLRKSIQWWLNELNNTRKYT